MGCRKSTYGYWRGMAGGVIGRLGLTYIYTTIYKQITNENLLYSSEKSTQYSVMTYMEKEYKIEGVYV